MIKLVQPSELQQVITFYENLIDGMQNAKFPTDWKKGIYPSATYLSDALRRQELFVDWQDDVIVSAMVLNSAANAGYEQANWSLDVADSEVLLIHTLGVAPQQQGHGIAQQMVKFAVDYARQQHKQTIHLDAIGTNLPAQKLYSACGFTCVGTFKLFYEDTGVTDFLLYELNL
ncbi:GNAT family N-acetyltransferase [Loigolactobacillus backii]|uniref:GCN5 family acetyltransferase n=1 Tax=Loigolactobacillus backii TaxID=375175 RepID=A0A192H2C0_9LACO|nr:GNAT family N-acetyltransferase [Loigolactobacillus backii]ANK62091.1 GCN5 family acetyltransferase [Loigolactobacillus backii]ANK68715.1 GCN5 family acetyltransferase [Loigolactobacillus backii]MDA5386719.1 GNAT family N-acetyltransferase [Loigolactobacillus backii]MDA5389244.1 GNAT family N-acetyltransferase [Loigolactobacillus backii]